MVLFTRSFEQKCREMYEESLDNSTITNKTKRTIPLVFPLCPLFPTKYTF